MNPEIRANVLAMTAYSPGKPISEVQRELGLEFVVRLSSNENPFGPSPLAVAAVKNAAEKMHIYPDAAAHELKRAIAEKFRISDDHVLVGNGSDELIHLLGLIFLGKETDEVVVGDPSFVRYDAAAQIAPCKLIKVPLNSDLRYHLPAIAARVTKNTKMVFIANPNNPTGTIVGRGEFDRFLDSLPASVLVILDEAYYEFAAAEPDFPTSVDYVRQGRNVVGLRTFSKAYGLAGIRIGYGFAAPAIVDAINRAREPFNANSLAQAAAIAALQDDEHVEKTVVANKRGLDHLAEIAAKIGGKLVPSFANFALIDLSMPSRPVFDALLKKGIIVRPGDVLGLPNCLRVSVGTKVEMDAFESAILEIFFVRQLQETTR